MSVPDHRLKEQGDISSRQENSYLRRPKTPERNLKLAKCMSCEIRLNGKQQKNQQQTNCDVRMHVAGNGQAAHQRQRAEAIDHVVNVESVARPLPLPHASQRAIQAIAEPVQRQKSDHRQQPVSVPAGERVSHASQNLGQESQQRQVIRVNPCRCALRHPQQSPFLRRRGDALLHSPRSQKRPGPTRLAEDPWIRLLTKFSPRTCHCVASLLRRNCAPIGEEWQCTGGKTMNKHRSISKLLISL